MHENLESLWKKNSRRLRLWLIRRLVGGGLDWNTEAALSLGKSIARYCPKGEVLCSLGPVNRLFPSTGDPVSSESPTRAPIVIEWEVLPYDFKVVDLEKYLETGIATEAP